ncbi:hypothetical protein TNIN_30671 [Trichonephila inaurata madagascariensis]|uniref:Uncharacterized protein n=1 Tax=Trichonephila inaurata madagascariensis TaxID=2747483 RepID=A0A8X6XCF2_9ARAC|nr:hypothetical protein TNIN_30671 [Trichonephila inaurata madagascariensis]
MDSALPQVCELKNGSPPRRDLSQDCIPILYLFITQRRVTTSHRIEHPTFYYFDLSVRILGVEKEKRLNEAANLLFGVSGLRTSRRCQRPVSISGPLGRAPEPPFWNEASRAPHAKGPATLPIPVTKEDENPPNGFINL